MNGALMVARCALSAAMVLGAALPAEAEETLSKIAVLDLGDKGVGGQAASLLTGVVTKQLSSYGLFEVMSREEIRKMLTHEQDKALMGCDDTSCLAEIGGALGAENLVAGDVGLVGKKYLITLQRIDIRQVKVVKRVERQFEGSPGNMIEQMRLAAHQVIEDVLKAASGTVLFSVSEEAADIAVDGNLVGTSPTGGIELPAGPHDVRVSKRGFVNWARTVQVKPRATEMVEVTLIPSADFIQAYEKSASRMRRWAWISAAAFVALEGAALGLRAYTWQKYDPIVDDYNAGSYGKYADAQTYYDHYKDDIQLADGLDYTALGLSLTGVVVGAISLYLFIEGEDPDRYESFRGVSSRGTAEALMPDSGGIRPIVGPGSITLGWSF